MCLKRLQPATDSQSSIFIQIASYRDSLCKAIEGAIRRARNASRLFFGVVEQTMLGNDEETAILVAFQPIKECSSGYSPRPYLCDYVLNGQIRVDRRNAKRARGPTWARERGDQLYRDEYFALQIDAHMIFALGWDVDAIADWISTNDDNAVLSAYPTSAVNAVDFHGRSLIETTPVIESTLRRQQQLSGLLRWYRASERLHSKPANTSFWAAGLSFSRGHRISNVPYISLPFLFTGEEAIQTIRMFTYGYNVYSFSVNKIFHIYPWERRRFHSPTQWAEAEVFKHGGSFIRMPIHRSTRVSTLSLRLLRKLMDSTTPL